MVKDRREEETVKSSDESRKLFFELQNELKEYVNDCQALTLKDLINDNVVVYDYKIKNMVQKDEENFRRIKKLLKRVNKLKTIEGSDDVRKAIIELFGEKPVETPVEKDIYHKHARNEFIPSLTPLETVNVLNEVNRHMDASTAKEDLNALRKMPEFHFKELTISRNLVASNSHAHVYKKFDNNQIDEEEKSGNQMVFQNGAVIPDSREAGSIPPNANNLFFNNQVSDKHSPKKPE